MRPSISPAYSEASKKSISSNPSISSLRIDIVVSYKVANSPASSAGTAPKVILLGQAELSSSDPQALVTAVNMNKLNATASILLNERFLFIKLPLNNLSDSTIIRCNYLCQTLKKCFQLFSVLLFMPSQNMLFLLTCQNELKELSYCSFRWSEC